MEEREKLEKEREAIRPVFRMFRLVCRPLPFAPAFGLEESCYILPFPGRSASDCNWRKNVKP